MRVLLCITLLLGGFPATGDTVVPFQTRDQNPLTLIYGLPAPTAADIAPPDSFALNWSANVSNTSIADRAGNEFLIVDGETYAADLTAAYGVSDNWELRIKFPFIAHSPGSLDRPIEKYHDWFGLPQGNRLETPRNRLLFAYQRNGVERLRLDKRHSGPGDIQLIAGRQIGSTEQNAYSAWASIKLPTGDSDRLTGSDAADISVWSAGRRSLSERWQLYGTVGMLFPGDGELLPGLQEDNVIFGSFGGQWQRWRSAVIKAQLEWHTGFYKDSGLRLLGDVLQLTFGASWEMAPALFFDFAIAEDIKEEASPDVNFHFTLRMRYD